MVIIIVKFSLHISMSWLTFEWSFQRSWKMTISTPQPTSDDKQTNYKHS